MAAASVPKLYRSVIDDVINNVREAFLDEGIDEQVLLELKQTWERKLLETKVIEQPGKEPETSASSQSGSNGQSVITQNSSTNQRQGSAASNHKNNQAVREQAANHNQQIHYGQQAQAQPSKQSQSQQQAAASQQQQQQQQAQPIPQQLPPPQPPQQQQQQQTQQQQHTRVIQQTATIQANTQGVPASGARSVPRGSSTIAQQLTLAPGSLMQPTLFQYTSGEGVDGQKTVTLLPQKVTFAFNPQTQNIQTVMSSPATAATLALPPELTASLLQQAGFNAGNVINVTQPQTSVVQHTSNQNNPMSAGAIQYQAGGSNVVGQRIQTVTRPSDQNQIVQLDGPNDSSEDDDDDDEYRDNDDDHEDNDEDQNEDENEGPGEEEEPLNSEDDVSDEDPTELFDTDNVVVCQYDKITRSRNKWKFHLKDGIMNLQGKDYVFQKAIGDAEW